MSQGRMLKVVTLDLDGTLIDDDAGTLQATLNAARELVLRRPALSVEAIARIHREEHARAWAPVLASPPPTTPAAWDPAPLVTRIWDATLRAAGVEIDHQLPALVERWLGDYATLSVAFQEAAAVVGGLASEGYRLGIITNGTPRIQWPKIRSGGFERRVERISIAGERGYGKPHLEIFLETLKSLGVRPADAVHVGDSLYADVGGAKAAGMKAVWINSSGAIPPPESATPDAVITSIAELPQVLATL
jgi:putative hydrolase of the HAD superfamily